MKRITLFFIESKAPPEASPFRAQLLAQLSRQANISTQKKSLSRAWCFGMVLYKPPLLPPSSTDAPMTGVRQPCRWNCCAWKKRRKLCILGGSGFWMLDSRLAPWLLHVVALRLASYAGWVGHWVQGSHWFSYIFMRFSDLHWFPLIFLMFKDFVNSWALLFNDFVEFPSAFIHSRRFL